MISKKNRQQMLYWRINWKWLLREFCTKVIFFGPSWTYFESDRTMSRSFDFGIEKINGSILFSGYAHFFMYSIFIFIFYRIVDLLMFPVARHQRDNSDISIKRNWKKSISTECFLFNYNYKYNCWFKRYGTNDQNKRQRIVLTQRFVNDNLSSQSLN